MVFDDGVWYSGVLSRYNARTGRFRVLFDDGDEQAHPASCGGPISSRGCPASRVCALKGLMDPSEA
jgi:hypothetical protein